VPCHIMNAPPQPRKTLSAKIRTAGLNWVS
jgi:hypothetical protein